MNPQPTNSAFDQQLVRELDLLVKQAQEMPDRSTGAMVESRLREAIECLDPTYNPAEVEKSFGQIGYEAYGRKANWVSLMTGYPLPQWSYLKPEIQAAWESAAGDIGLQFEIRRVKLSRACAPDW